MWHLLYPWLCRVLCPSRYLQLAIQPGGVWDKEQDKEQDEAHAAFALSLALSCSLSGSRPVIQLEERDKEQYKVQDETHVAFALSLALSCSLSRSFQSSNWKTGIKNMIKNKRK